MGAAAEGVSIIRLLPILHGYGSQRHIPHSGHRRGIKDATSGSYRSVSAHLSLAVPPTSSPPNFVSERNKRELPVPAPALAKDSPGSVASHLEGYGLQPAQKLSKTVSGFSPRGKNLSDWPELACQLESRPACYHQINGRRVLARSRRRNHSILHDSRLPSRRVI